MKLPKSHSPLQVQDSSIEIKIHHATWLGKKKGINRFGDRQFPSVKIVNGLA